MPDASPRSARDQTGRLARLVIAAVVAGVVVRLAFGLLYWIDKPLTRDETEYLSLARSLAAGDGFVYDEVLQSASFMPFGRAPGYPAFLALVGGGSHVSDAVPTSVKVAQAIVGGLGIVMAAVLALRLASPRAAVAAAWLAALYPPLVWTAGYALSEGLFWPIGLLTAWLFDRAADRRASGRATAALACGVICGVGILVRPALILFLPLAGVLLSLRRQWVPLGALALGALVVVGPWTIRNYAVHERLMVVASDGGVTFWTGNHPLAIGEGDMAANPAIKGDDARLRAEHPGLTEEEMEPIYYQEAFAWIADHPVPWLGLELRKLFYLIVPIGPSYTLHSTRYFALSLLSYLTLLALAVVGARALGPKLARTPGLWLLALSAVAICLVFFPQERFRIPIVDPTLVVVASAAVARWWPVPAGSPGSR